MGQVISRSFSFQHEATDVNKSRARESSEEEVGLPFDLSNYL